LQVLGRGGFGIVLKAFDEVLRRVVAVKVLAPEVAATSPARKRFLREARASARVRHENVIHVYAIEETPLPYLVMEYIPGQTLQQRMDAVGPLPTDEAVQIGIQIARGLAAAHETGLIHRDVKPGNVLLESGPEQRAKLTDFGLARAADDASISQSGAVTGTPLYMAPEQARGDQLDHRADLFSLGSVLYAMVSGRPPFRAANKMAVLKRVCYDDPRPLREIIPEVPQWLCTVIAKLHAKEPAERYQSAREVVEALTKGQTAAPTAPRGSGRKRALAGVAILLALLAAGVVYWATRDSGSTKEQANNDPRADGKALTPIVNVAPPDVKGSPPVENAPPPRLKAAPPVRDLALKLDGNQVIRATSLVRDEDDPVTLECWFKIDQPSAGYRTVLALGGKAPVWISQGPEKIAPMSFRVPKDSWAQAGSLTPGTWEHVAVVFDQRETRFYLDGKLQASFQRLDPPADHQRWPAPGFTIGSTYYKLPSGRFVGLLDEVRVSKTARYKEDFAPRRRFEPDADTLALYHCDEGTGSMLTDASANGHHSTTFTGATWVEVAP
jgi:hypothetical protein